MPGAEGEMPPGQENPEGNQFSGLPKSDQSVDGQSPAE